MRSTLMGLLLVWVGGFCVGMVFSDECRADVFATSKNQAGGELVLLTNQGSCDKGERAIIARGPKGDVTQGCWFWQDPYIFVTYANGQQRMYDDKGWTLGPKVREQMKPKYEY